MLDRHLLCYALIKFEPGRLNMNDSIPWREAPTSHKYYSQRLRLHYVDWGNTAADPMLLVHGFRDHCHTWDSLARHFAPNYHVVAPDLRGHGDSEWVRGSSYHFLDYVYDLDQLALQAEHAPATVIAHSMGGTLALIFAACFPEKVERLVVIEAVGNLFGRHENKPVEERIRDWVNNTRELAGRQPRRYPNLEEAYARMQEANPHLMPEQARHLTVHGSNQNEDGTYTWKYDNYTHAWPAFNVGFERLTELWQQITCPILIINSVDGFEHRVGQDDTADLFQIAQVVNVADAGHWTYHDQLEEVVGTIQEFLD